jgi:hypothetical protein
LPHQVASALGDTKIDLMKLIVTSMEAGVESRKQFDLGEFLCNGVRLVKRWDRGG